MKQYLFEYLNEHLSAPRERYHELINSGDELESILLEGAVKARETAMPFIEELRRSVGIRPLNP